MCDCWKQSHIEQTDFWGIIVISAWIAKKGLITGWLNAQTYHGTQHSGHIDGISPGRAVLVSIRHKFGVFIQDLQTDIQYSYFKLKTEGQLLTELT